MEPQLSLGTVFPLPSTGDFRCQWLAGRCSVTIHRCSHQSRVMLALPDGAPPGKPTPATRLPAAGKLPKDGLAGQSSMWYFSARGTLLMTSLPS